MEKVAEWIGVTSGAGPALRQHLLLFDRLAFLDFPASLRGCRMRGQHALADDLETLHRHGIAFGAFDGQAAELPPPDESLQWRSLVHSTFEDLARTSTPLTPDGSRHVKALLVRYTAPIVQQGHGGYVTPICENSIAVPPALRDRRQGVIHLLVSGIPAPGDDAPIETMLRFREDTRHLRLQLRKWIGTMARSNYSMSEIADEMEALASDYARALEVAKMKREASVIETFLTPAEGGWAEYIPKVASKLFSVRHARIDLMKDELTMPGREVAYIVKAREEFGK